MRQKMARMLMDQRLQSHEQATFITNINSNLNWSQGDGIWTQSGKKVVYRGILPAGTLGHIHTHPGAPNIGPEDLPTYQLLNNRVGASMFYIVGNTGSISRYDISGNRTVLAEGGDWMMGDPCAGKGGGK